ncbi:MAG: hypothetical protein HKO57_12595 [Akkermansiaceae bacterium]|nr:hypothetical protein [Akkermansiaceae bacterium]
MAAVITTAAGVFHAYVKNRQIDVARQIEETEQRVAQHELDIKTLQMRLDRELNRYLVRDRLQQIASDLVPIPVMSVEEIKQNPKSPILPDLAGRSP